MKHKFFTFLFAALMSASMFGMTVQQDIALNQESWGWGYNSSLSFNDGIMTCTLTGEWGAASTGWNPVTDLSDWDKIVILVENMSGCDGEYFKLKAYLRDNTESEANQMEGVLGLDAPDNQQNYLVIDLHQDKACDLTKARILAIQCQTNGAVFKISRVYLEKEEEFPQVAEPDTAMGVNHDEEDVMALYCNHYTTNNLNFNVLGWGGVQTWETLTLGADSTKVLYCQDMKWEMMTNWDAESYDLSMYKKFHCDLWVPFASKMKVTFEAKSGWKKGVEFSLNEGWNTIDCDPAWWNTDSVTYDWKDVKYIAFEGYMQDTVSAEGNPFAFANLYFWNEPAPKNLPAVAPAAPTMAEDHVQSLFSATYKNRTYNFAPTNWGTQWVDYTYSTGEQIYHTESMAWDCFTNWDYSSYNLTEYDMMHVDVYVTVNSKLRITFEALGVGDGGSGWKGGASFDLVANQWNSIDIDLLGYPYDSYDFTDLRYLILEGFQKSDSGSAEGTPLSIANVYFWNSMAYPRNLSVVCDPNQGRVTGSGQYDMGSRVTISAIPNSGYHFTQWSDGVTENPRTITLTQDTTFTAEFVQYIYRNIKIGDLYYELNTDTKSASVMGLSGGEANVSVTDNSIAEWNNLPEEYVFEAKCPNDAVWYGLKSVKVYADPTYINILIEPNMDELYDLDWMPFHVYINTDNSDVTGGYSNQFADANTDIMLEGAVFVDGKPVSYSPAVFKWWGEVGGEGWEWTDPSREHSSDDCWGTIICEGELSDCNSQFVDGKIEMKINRQFIPANWSDSELGIGFDIQQNWTSVGVLPSASPTDENPRGLANKLKVTIDKNKYSHSTDTISSDLVIPSSVVYKNETFAVTTIRESAFENNESITSVTISNGVTSIGDQAFEGCTNLNAITILGNIERIGSYVFYGCRNITYFEGPVLVYRAIYSENLQTVIINGGEAEDMSNYWFGGNIQKLDLAALETSFLPSHVLGGHYQLKELVLPAHLESIGYMAVTECIRLQSISIPALVVEIDDRAFEDCRSLKSVTFEGTALTRIGDWAFYNCHELASINLPEGLTEIGKAAFYGCIYAENLKVPASVQSIGDNAFALCSKLNRMDVDAFLPPAVEAKTFYEVSRKAPVYVPDESVNLYKNDPIWGELNIVGKSNIPQGIDQIFESSNPQIFKFIKDGQIYILRGENVYTIHGKKVK